MTATWTREEIEAAELVLVSRPDGSYQWSSHRTAHEVAAWLQKVAAEIVHPVPLDTPQRPAAHTGAGDTERLAQYLAVPKLESLRAKVLDALFIHTRGLTDREISDVTQVYLYSIAPRRTELVNMGWVRDCGDRRTITNRPAAVWVLTDAGRAKYETEIIGAD